jgi:trans-aconitate 2-methyltransferase
MPTWNADQYLKFEEERTQPCRDLVARLPAAGASAIERSVNQGSVRSIVDLGCGPGNSTRILAEKWPWARISGIDNSASMIDVARREQPQRRWVVSDIVEWAVNEHELFDIVFSNAALQWVPDHATVYPQLIARVAPGGVMAVQIPSDIDSPPHRMMRENAPPDLNIREWHAHPAAFYYDLLAPLTARIDMWETEYQHVLPNAEAIVEWYKGSGLRPFLDSLPTESDREQFLAEYLNRIRAAYPVHPAGKVLFPFRRLFLIAYKNGV